MSQRTELSGAATVRSNVDRVPGTVEIEAWFAAGTGVQGPNEGQGAKGSRVHEADKTYCSPYNRRPRPSASGRIYSPFCPGLAAVTLCRLLAPDSPLTRFRAPGSFSETFDSCTPSRSPPNSHRPIPPLSATPPPHAL